MDVVNVFLLDQALDGRSSPDKLRYRASGLGRQAPDTAAPYCCR
jgi:hypothetical protein